jgi:hypothetical protein
MSEDDKDASVAEQLRETFAGDGKKQIPPERETSPEMDDATREIMEMATAAFVSGLKVVAAGLGRGWNSLCLIGPSLERIAAAHETLAKEAKIYNDNYQHDIDQTHHSVKG